MESAATAQPDIMEVDDDPVAVVPSLQEARAAAASLVTFMESNSNTFSEQQQQQVLRIQGQLDHMVVAQSMHWCSRTSAVIFHFSLSHLEAFKCELKSVGGVLKSQVNQYMLKPSTLASLMV